MKKILSSVLAAAMVASVASISVFAAAPATRNAATVQLPALAADVVVNGDGETLLSKGATVTPSTGSMTLDNVRPSSTFYIKIANDDVAVAAAFEPGSSVVSDDLMDKKLFTFKANKETGSKLIKSVSLEGEKSIDGVRANWIKVVLNDTLSTSEQKAVVEMTFKAKKDTTNDTANNGYSGSTTLVKSGDTITFDLTLWISNEEKGNDSNPDVGDRIYIKPEKNETNTIIWGDDDRAALTFESNDDAAKFYARLNTKNDSAIWRDYADPVDADLWFYDFVGASTIPATSRATLTLGVPWDDDDDYRIDPEDAFIYEKDADGYLIDVTSKFTYSEDDAEIEGWSIKTRTLGTYIVSDTELDLDVYDDDDDVSEAEDVDTNTGAKPIPDTGASDMVNVAVVAGIVSLAAAGAVAFRKAK